MTTRVILILDSERQCPECKDTGFTKEDSGRGGTISSPCMSCHTFAEMKKGWDTTRVDLDARFDT